MALEPLIRKELLRLYEKHAEDGTLKPPAEIQACYSMFRARFGPEVLKKLDGAELLSTMHDSSNRDSLVYWLEFKDDDEFPAVFGSIAGGSALKFGLYRRVETGEWMTGSPQAQQALTLQDAIAMARRNRDQLLLGHNVLEAFSGNGRDKDYLKLENDLSKVAPNLANSAWGHKYFALMFPTKLDDFHSAIYQRFQLLKLLQTPPEGEGRYVCAGRFVEIARTLGLPINTVTTFLNLRNGNPHRYWRVGTTSSSSGKSQWESMKQGGIISVGWGEIPSLSGIEKNRESKEKIRQFLIEEYGNRVQQTGRDAQQLFNFVAGINERDIVLACEGATVLGIGRVTGGYEHQPEKEFPHARKVEWISTQPWKMPKPEGLRTTIHPLRKELENLIEAERLILLAGEKPSAPHSGNRLATLSEFSGRIAEVLDRKQQVILFGPPGTGKTFWAIRTARELASRFNFDCGFDTLTKEQRSLVDPQIPGTQEEKQVRLCCFHPSYGYEDFVEGYRPVLKNEGLHYHLVSGVFKRLCNCADQNPQKRFFLIIDEINRGDISRIFGELLLCLERDKRGTPVLLPMSGETLVVPPNVFLLGTMNTADRSIALLDTALRRRFGFIELMPDYSLFEGTVIESIPLGLWLKALNQRIREHLGMDARNLQVGHSYFLDGEAPLRSLDRFAHAIREDIIPLLQEYCYEDETVLEKLLGSRLFDRRLRRIREELFNGENDPELIAALLEPCPELATAGVVVRAEAESLAQEETAALGAEDEAQS